MDYTSSLLSGIISGIITSIIIFTFSILFKKILIPYYADMIYRGVRIEGTWNGVNKTPNSEIRVVCTIKQNSFDITGTFAVETTYSTGKQYSNNYEIEGFINGNMLTLTYKASDRSRTGTGVLMFQILSGGKELRGKAIHSENGNGIGVFDNFIFKKN